MKYAVALLAAMAFTAMAGPVDQAGKAIEVRDPVDIAAQLYIGCLRGNLMALSDARAEAPKIKKSLDTNCLFWTLIWYPAMMDGDEISAWPEGQTVRFLHIRNAVLASIK